MSTSTFDLAAAVAVAQSLATRFPLLPAPHIQISGIAPSEVTLHLHDGAAQFEAWREALEIDPPEVGYSEAGSAGYLRASLLVGLISVKMIGYCEASREVAL